jgi:uncharacterized protein
VTKPAKWGRPKKVDPVIDLLFIDIEAGNNDKVVEILQLHGVDATDGYGRTALINASASGNTNLVKWCIDNSSSLEHQDRGGMTALQFAVQEGRMDIAKLLVNSGAKIDKKTAKKLPADFISH